MKRYEEKKVVKNYFMMSALFLLLACATLWNGSSSKTAKAAKLSAKKMTIKVGQTKTLKLKNVKKTDKVNWYETAMGHFKVKKKKNSWKITGINEGKGVIGVNCIRKKKVIYSGDCDISVVPNYKQSEVSALNQFIKEQNAAGAKLPTKTTGSLYQWSGDGHLTSIKWKGYMMEDEDTELGLSGDLDLSAFPELQEASFDGAFSSINVQSNSKLTKLEVGGDQLTSIDVSNNLALKVLSVSSKELASIDVTHNAALEELSLNSNKLASIDVSKNAALKKLGFGGAGRIGQSALTTLDVSNNPALEYLDITKTAISSIDLSKNPELKKFHFGNTNIKEIDLSANTKLERIGIDAAAQSGGNPKVTGIPASCSILYFYYSGDENGSYIGGSLI